MNRRQILRLEFPYCEDQENKIIQNIRERDELVKELAIQRINKRIFFGTFYYAVIANHEEREEIRELAKKYAEFEIALLEFINKKEPS